MPVLTETGQLFFGEFCFFAAIQGLNQKLEEKDTQIKMLQEQLDELKITIKQLGQAQTK